MLIDSHCHLAGEEFAADLPAVVARAREAGLGRLLCIISSDTPEELTQAPVVREAWPEVEFATAIHPHRAGAYAGRVDDAERVVREAAGRLPAVVLGEMGLDYHYDFAPRDVQQQVFAAQVAVALELDLPIAIHTREAADDTFAILAEAGQGRVRGVMHCFTAGLDEARRALDLGFYLSIPGIVTFPKAAALREVVAQVPADRLLVETDAPYLAPVPHRGKRNEPGFITQTVSTVAECQGLPLDRMIARIHENYERLVGVSRVDTPPKPVVSFEKQRADARAASETIDQ
ncbi:MAG: hypothetical protein AMXMBFR57_32620 [Acidimicrobiia bacterium]